MALVLPYPNLDFVPLDVLTAEQMNKMVANTNYIANQFPLTKTNISSNINVVNATTTNAKVTSLTVKCYINEARVAVISGIARMQGSFEYGEEIFRIPGVTTDIGGTAICSFKNLDFGTPSGASYIKFAMNAAGTNLNGYNGVCLSLILK